MGILNQEFGHDRIFQHPAIFGSMSEFEICLMAFIYPATIFRVL